jgi:hypothetical protein
MSSKSNLIDHVTTTILQPGDEVLLATIAQVKGGMKKELAKSTAQGIAAGLLVTAVSGGAVGLLSVSIPPAVWLVVTKQRLLLINKDAVGKGLGAVVFDAPRAALAASLKSGLLNEVTILDPQDGQSLLRINLGMKKGTAKEIVAAVEAS